MVQRKMNKLGIQAGEVKTNELLLVNRKASSFQLHDAKNNKGADLKKKMKKSRPASKRSDIERLSSSATMTRQGPQPGKPPPPIASPQKKSPATAPGPARSSSEAIPNYMKSTSSSDARREPLQVSSRNLQTLLDANKISSSEKSSTKISSSSVPNAARTLARTSSLKLVRTSFKPARTSSVKRCPPHQVLSENLNSQSQWATCSSTLKNSKFPAYLEISSGGGESEGTSVMKVCPYTYCSLNGHHHPPLPPLRSFLSARRRMLKAQRVVKLGCISPRRSNPTAQIVKDQVKQMKFDESFPNLEEKSGNFFVQIYSKEREYPAEITENFHHVRPLVEENPGDDVNQQVPEILLEESPYLDTESRENSDAISKIMDDEVSQNVEGEEGHSLFPTQKEATMESMGWSHDEVEGREIIAIDNAEFELSDMDWEADNYSNSLQDTEDFELQFGSSVSSFKEIQTGGLLQQSSSDEESVSSKDTYQNFKIQEYIEGPDDKSNDQLWAATDEDDGPVEECGKTTINATLILPEKQTEEPCPADRNVEKSCLQDDNAAEEIWDSVSQYFQEKIEQSSEEGWKDPTDSKEEVNPLHSDVNYSITTFEPEAVNGSISPEDASRGLDDNHLEPHDSDGRSDETLEESTSRVIGSNAYQELAETSNKLKWGPRGKRFSEEYKEPKEFNPRGPNFLPLEPDPEAEKVDLKHQMIDEHKNTDEWMLDHAIQRAVTKLGQARKKKVALLVEAFETVMPIPKFETQQRHASVAFPHARTIQACS